MQTNAATEANAREAVGAYLSVLVQQHSPKAAAADKGDLETINQGIDILLSGGQIVMADMSMAGRVGFPSEA
jgi:hypothetical protein